jgi:hypothetical protein
MYARAHLCMCAEILSEIMVKAQGAGLLIIDWIMQPYGKGTTMIA